MVTSAYVASDATVSILRTIFPGLIIYSGAPNHASMIEGVRLGGVAERDGQMHGIEIFNRTLTRACGVFAGWFAASACH